MINSTLLMSIAGAPQLHDIVVPANPGIWPLAIGWWLLIALIVSLFGIAISHFMSHRRRWAIKRLALEKLPNCESCNDINQLLKQVAIHYCPAQNIGPLTDKQWTNFLAKNLPNAQHETLNDIHQALYRPEHAQYQAQYQTLAQHWLSNLSNTTVNEMNHAVI
ncbi:MAG: DUF4381 domain-containing protein [Psychrobium sp.]